MPADSDESVSIFSDGSTTSIAPEWNQYITTSGWIDESVAVASDSKAFSCTSSNFFAAKFSSANNSAAFGAGQDSLLKNGILMSIPQDAAIPDQTVDTVKTKFGISNNIPGVLGKIIQLLSTRTKVKVDVHARRNAIWIIPQDANSLQVSEINHWFFHRNITSNLD
jgi:hypothetical protein